MTREINVVGPQFDRAAPREIAPAPDTREKWAALYNRSFKELLELGLSPWEDENPTLMLFPAEWADHIPEGLTISNIFGETRYFSRAKMKIANERRGGCLPFGIKVKR